jgi:hypothetical protein
MIDTHVARFPGLDADDANIEDLAALPVIDFGGPHHDNTVRASFAASALVAYTGRRGSDTLETDLADLLADMRHLADALGINFRDALVTSGVNYLAETGETHE